MHVSWDCRDLGGDSPRRARRFLNYYRVRGKADVSLACVPEYPAKLEDYGKMKNWTAFSDHVVGLGLWEKYRPEIWEKHFVLEPNSPDNPDSMGGFAMDPDQLKEVIG